ncbi:MAG TPA: Stp1/IreP family PP2C-type Ser/Thr phosphatase [Candidatus Binataceae bacterium]|nr:Stp1/IreP family PP2C-type Ser/Thr phosphatase [Candidatus Binataceae bacterium]
MITCPECGQTAPDETRFCDRCGRGLHDVPAPVALAPLAVGTELAARFKIVELLSQSSEENRYRALSLEDSTRVILREREAPPPLVLLEESEATSSVEPALTEDPTGPHAKTADLSLRAAAQEEAVPAAQEVEASAPLSAAPSEQARVEPEGEPAPPASPANNGAAPPRADLGEVFERVLALSHNLTHPAFYCAQEGFVAQGRAYLLYRDEGLTPFARGQRIPRQSPEQAISITLQLCQGLAFLHRRGLRLNDLCPASMMVDSAGRLKLTGLDYVSNDTELQEAPILNDGYTAPEVYRGKSVDKRADIFSAGCVLYSLLTGERLECETWREEAGAVRLYPPHVIAPALEKTLRRALAFKPGDRFPNVDAFKAELLGENAAFSMRCGAVTDVGMVREHNEDALLTWEYFRDSEVEPASRYLYVISDGMGGAEAGEVAAAIAVQTIRDYVENGRTAHTPLADLLREALEEANRKILEKQAQDPAKRGMGATAVAALIEPPEAAIAWVGDSRIYRWEQGKLYQLSKDHSLVQRLIEIGQITPEEARHHEHKNVITRSLGARAAGPAGAEATALRLKRGDRLLLCSDGLIAHVEDSQIAEILGRQADPHAASLELVVAANAGGGTDNTSVIVIDTQ